MNRNNAGSADRCVHGRAAAFALLLFGLSTLAAAQTVDPDTLSGDNDGEPQPKWEAGIAGAAISVPTYPAADQSRQFALPAPYFVYHGKTLQSDDQGSRLRQLLSPNVELSLSGAAALSSDSRHSDARQGMPDLGYLLEAGPNVRLIFEGPQPSSKVFIDLPVRGVVSVDHHVNLGWQGLVFSPELSYETQRLVSKRLSLRASLGMDIAGAALQRYFYEVKPQYATADRPAYSSKGMGYLGSSLSGRASYDLSKRASTFAELEYDNYGGGENKDSPLFRSNHGYTALVGFSWSFLQSSERAEK